MTNLRKRNDAAWRSALTPAEAAEIADIDKRAAKLDAERRELTSRRGYIQRRANQRALAATRRKEHAP